MIQVHGTEPTVLVTAASSLEQKFDQSSFFKEARYQTSLSEVTNFLEAIAPYRLLLDPRPPQDILANLKPLLQNTK